MPTYDYVCRECSEPFEIQASISEYSKGLRPQCPSCRSKKAIRAFTSINILAGRPAIAGAAAPCCPLPGPGCRR